MLYIPAGTWRDVVYGDGRGWYLFNNIREMAADTQSLSSAQAYTLMNVTNGHYAVYDAVNDKVRTDYAHHSVDESNVNNCWQLVEKDGKRGIYNIGAKKFARMMDDGSITLQDAPVFLTKVSVN